MASKDPNPDANPAWSSWPGVTAAAGRLGIRRQAIAQHVEDGELEEVVALDGTKRYSPESIDKLAASLRTMVANELRSETSADVMRASIDLLKQEQEHNRRLVEMLIDGFERTMTAVNTANQRLSEENLKLATVHWEAISARELAMSEESDRRNDAAKVDAANKRRQQILDTVLPGVPKVVAAIGQALLAWGFQASPEAQLLESIQDDQLEALVESMFLSEEQKQLLRQYLARRKAARNGDQEGKQEAGEEGKQEAGKEGKQEAGKEGSEEKQREEGFASTT